MCDVDRNRRGEFSSAGRFRKSIHHRTLLGLCGATGEEAVSSMRSSHARWRVWNATRAGFSGDAAGLCRVAFAQVLIGDPDSAFLAEGSPVTVFNGTRLS